MDFSSKLFFETHLLLEICRLRMFVMARGVVFWVPPVMISLNIFFKKLIRRTSFWKICSRKSSPGVPKNLPLAPLKTCAIDRSRGVDVFKKKFARKVHLWAKLSTSNFTEKMNTFLRKKPILGNELFDIPLTSDRCSLCNVFVLTPHNLLRAHETRCNFYYSLCGPPQ